MRIIRWLRSFLIRQVQRLDLLGRPSLSALTPLPSVQGQLLQGKNVLVTGAGRNIGKEIAREMALQGANIYFVDIDRDLCEALERELSSQQIRAQGFVADVSNRTDLDSLLEQLRVSGIEVDILVNNVGIGTTTNRLEDVSLDELQHLFNTNVFGPFYLTQRVAETMKQRKIRGSILFITSIHEREIFRKISYSGSKAALGMLVKELAVELAPANIRVNGIAPGFTRLDETGKPILHSYTPLYQTSIPPAYIGRAAVYLAADYYSAHTTGTILTIDAGLSLYNYRVLTTPPEYP